LDYWLTYLTDFYKTSGGVLTPVKLGAVKRGLIQIAKEEIEKEEIENFNQMMDNLVKKYMITSFDHDNSMKAVVNF
jgi:hypothetical protein